MHTTLFCDQFFIDKMGETVRLAIAKTPAEIPTKEAQQTLVASFLTAYENVPLAELNPDFKSSEDVRRFYQDYFESEFAHFQNGSLIWVQAFIGKQLVGWATFELEDKNQAYLNLLAVDPSYQKRGIGKHLVFFLCSETSFPLIETIHVLLRKINLQGRRFYESIGFRDAPNYQRKDDFVDNDLLIPICWQIKHDWQKE